MTFQARVATHGAEDGYDTIEINNSFSEATNPLQAAKEHLQDRGYTDGIVYAREDSPTILAQIESGYQPADDQVAHLDDF